jgi:tetratricopeptide (TPR) repeat protein
MPVVALLSWLLLSTACGTSKLVTAPSTGAVEPSGPSARLMPVAVDPPDPGAAADDLARHAVLAPGLDPALFRDHRRPPRALALLVVEIQQLEMLFRATVATSPDRPLIQRRIAEDYVELEKAATAESVLPGDPARRDTRRRTAEQARRMALRSYEDLVTQFPADPRTDEARYFLAYEREQARDLAGARRAYLDLITQSPSSRYVPLAYLAFGEMFFSEAADDPSKWEIAKQAYRKVLDAPPPANEAYAYAWYRLGYVLVNQGDRDGALHALEKAVEAATAFPQVPGAAALREEAEGQRRALSP